MGQKGFLLGRNRLHVCLAQLVERSKFKKAGHLGRGEVLGSSPEDSYYIMTKCLVVKKKKKKKIQDET